MVLRHGYVTEKNIIVLRVLYKLLYIASNKPLHDHSVNSKELSDVKHSCLLRECWQKSVATTLLMKQLSEA